MSAVSKDISTPDFKGNPEEISLYIKQILSEYPQVRTGQDTAYLTGTDGMKRALGIHVPQSYTPDHPMPAVIWLHGGVNGDRKDRGAEVAHYFAKESDSLYFLFAAVSGERGATWFDETGISNIQMALHYLKTHYNIDDDRVILSGVSDGGTGCYVSGMNYPDEYAGYIICSSSPEILPMMGIPFLAGNMRLRSWHIVHGGHDRLYPGEKIKTIVEQLKSLGIKITFDYYEQMPHGLDYMPQEKPAIMQFIKSTFRVPCPKDISFETFNRMKVAWLSVDSIIPPQSFGETSPGSIEGHFKGNILLLSSKGIRAISLYIPVELLDFNKKVQVLWNGKTIFDGFLKQNTDIMLMDAIKTRARSFMPRAKLELTLND